MRPFTLALSHSRTLALSRAGAPKLALALLAALGAAACARADARPARELRVCADPNNLPFSNARGEGFENRIAELVARDLGARVRYTWWAQRRGFFRSTLRAGTCDVVIGMPTTLEMAAPTRPYYRSTYVFVTRRDRGLDVRSFDDPRLKTLKIGVQIVGDDGFNTPPVHALSRRGVVGNLKGYTVYGDYSRPNPPAAIIDAVANGEVDLAIAWGPLAGYFAKRARAPLSIVPVSPQIDPPFLPFIYDISMGTRRGDTLGTRLDEVIVRRRAEIERILDDYGVPRAEGRRR
ncbi:MAG: substrate-binding domain-containing protein [Longimicrobiaceae bacterium]